MSSTPVTLIAPQNIENATTPKYTAPITSKGSAIDKFQAVNYSAATVTVTVWVIPLGQAAQDSYLRAKDISIPAGQSYGFPELVGLRLEPGSFISWRCSTANAANGTATGREFA